MFLTVCSIFLPCQPSTLVHDCHAAAYVTYAHHLCSVYLNQTRWILFFSDVRFWKVFSPWHLLWSQCAVGHRLVSLASQSSQVGVRHQVLVLANPTLWGN